MLYRKLLYYIGLTLIRYRHKRIAGVSVVWAALGAVGELAMLINDRLWSGLIYWGMPR